MQLDRHPDQRACFHHWEVLFWGSVTLGSSSCAVGSKETSLGLAIFFFDGDILWCPEWAKLPLGSTTCLKIDLRT